VSKKYKEITKYKNNLLITNIPDETELIKQDAVFAQKRKEWFEAISKDAYVDEAINVLGDIKTPNASKSLPIKKTKLLVKS